MHHKAIMIALFKLDFTDRHKVREYSYFFEDFNILTATKDCFLEIAAKMSTLLNDQRLHSSRASQERSIFQPPTVTSFINAFRGLICQNLMASSVTGYRSETYSRL